MIFCKGAASSAEKHLPSGKSRRKTSLRHQYRRSNGNYKKYAAWLSKCASKRPSSRDADVTTMSVSWANSSWCRSAALGSREDVELSDASQFLRRRVVGSGWFYARVSGAERLWCARSGPRKGGFLPLIATVLHGVYGVRPAKQRTSLMTPLGRRQFGNSSNNRVIRKAFGRNGAKWFTRVLPE